MSRRRIGRVRVDFAVIERFASEMIEDNRLSIVRDSWTLSRKSSLHRRKDGSYTLCLIWKSPDGLTLTSTTRGLRLEAA